MDRAGTIDSFLGDHEESSDSIVDYIRYEHEKLVNHYGYRLINQVEEACTMQVTTDEEEACKKKVDKLTKKTIFEIASTVAFLAGMVACYEELKGKR